MNEKEQQIENVLKPGRNSGFLRIDKIFLLFGAIESLLLKNLLSKYDFFYKKEQIRTDQPFFLIQNELMHQLNITVVQLRAARQNLIDFNIIYIKRSGIPPKWYYSFNWCLLQRFQNYTKAEPHHLKAIVQKMIKDNPHSPLNEIQQKILSNVQKMDKFSNTQTTTFYTYGKYLFKKETGDYLQVPGISSANNTISKE